VIDPRNDKATLAQMLRARVVLARVASTKVIIAVIDGLAVDGKLILVDTAKPVAESLIIA
jgi:hypothetical protein